LKNEFSVQLVETYEQVQQLINEFEPNFDLRRKGLLSLDGMFDSKEIIRLLRIIVL
jgi:hypothetical protein